MDTSPVAWNIPLIDSRAFSYQCFTSLTLQGQYHCNVTSNSAPSMVPRCMTLHPAEAYCHYNSEELETETLAIVDPEILDKIQNLGYFSRWPLHMHICTHLLIVYCHPDFSELQIKALAILHPKIFEKNIKFKIHVFSRWLPKIKEGHHTCPFTPTHLLHTVIPIQKNFKSKL